MCEREREGEGGRGVKYILLVMFLYVLCTCTKCCIWFEVWIRPCSTNLAASATLCAMWSFTMTTGNLLLTREKLRERERGRDVKLIKVNKVLNFLLPL